jgi:hypothetical protein
MEKNVFHVIDKLFKREVLNQEVVRRQGEILAGHALDFALNYFIERDVKNARRCILDAWRWDKKAIDLFYLSLFVKTLLGKRVITFFSKKKQALKKSHELT